MVQRKLSQAEVNALEGLLSLAAIPVDVWVDDINLIMELAKQDPIIAETSFRLGALQGVLSFGREVLKERKAKLHDNADDLGK